MYYQVSTWQVHTVTVTLHCTSNKEQCSMYMCYTSMALEALATFEDGTSQLDCLLVNSFLHTLVATGCNKMHKY